MDIRNVNRNIIQLLNTLRSLNFYCLNNVATRVNSCLYDVINDVSLGMSRLDLLGHDGLWLKIARHPLFNKYYTLGPR